MKKLKIVYIGTGSLGVPILNALIDDDRVEVPLVVTGLDKRVGRKLQLRPNDIKVCALTNNLIVQQCGESGPEGIAALNNKIAQEEPDFLLLTAFGALIPASTLAIPTIAPINIHWSLLPKFRGASPIQSAILAGENTSGITWIIMNEKMDQGDVIHKEEVKISPADTSATLTTKMTKIAAQKTVDKLFEYQKNRNAQKQDHSASTFTYKIKKEDGHLNFEQDDAETILRKIRAYIPWPGCFTFVNGKRLKVMEASIVEQKIDTKTLLQQDEKLLVSTSKGTLSLDVVQPEGRSIMPIANYLNGLQGPPTF